MFGTTNSPLILYLMYINSDIQSVAYEYHLQKEIEELQNVMLQEKKKLNARICALDFLRRKFPAIADSFERKSLHYQKLLNDYNIMLRKVKRI